MEFNRVEFSNYAQSRGYGASSGDVAAICAHRIFDFNMLHGGIRTWEEAAKAFVGATGKYKALAPSVGKLMTTYFSGKESQPAPIVIEEKSEPASAQPVTLTLTPQMLTEALMDLLSSPERLSKELLEETTKRQSLEVALATAMDNVKHLDSEGKKTQDGFKGLQSFALSLAELLEVTVDESMYEKIKAEITELRNLEQPVSELVAHWRDTAKKAQSDYERLNKCHLDLMDEVRKLKENMAFHDMLVSECKNLHKAGTEIRSQQFLNDRQRITRVLQMMRVVA